MQPRRSAMHVAACLTAALMTACPAPTNASNVVLTVNSDGNGQFASVQQALDSLDPGNNTSLGHVTLLISGSFWERVHIYSNFSNGVSFIGQGSSPEDALIAFNVSGASGPGTFGSWTVKVEADNFTAANIAIANSADDYNHKVAGQSVALDIESDRAAFYNVRLYGAQDTLFTGSKRVYFAELWINGTCDAIFGSGAAVFERATIRMNYTVTAHKGGASVPGNGTAAYLFIDSDVDSLGGTADLELGRPWGPTSTVVFLNTTMGAGISPAGWDDWGHNCTVSPPVPGTTWCNETFYAEFNSSGPGADPGARVWWSHQLDALQAAAWTVERVLGDWTPQFSHLLP